MNCQEFVDFLMSYLDGELPAAQRTSFEQHISDCPECDTFLDTYRRTVADCRSVCSGLDDPVPEDVPEELVQAILGARRSD